jgi:sulfane dehydrogenase subunit SoxC
MQHSASSRGKRISGANLISTMHISAVGRPGNPPRLPSLERQRPPLLLDEAGVDPRGKWILAESADAAGMSRSIPLDKALGNTIVTLYHGEHVRPENGYPLRLVVPGWIGNINVKWLRRIKVTGGPTETKDEASRYTELRPDGKAWQFQLVMDVRSVICRPSCGLKMTGPGFCEISGLAWSGHGRISKVEVSADGGSSWAEAALQDPVLPVCLTGWQTRDAVEPCHR